MQHERIQSFKLKGGESKSQFIMGNVASSCISITSEADITASKFCQFLFKNLGIGEIALTQFFDAHGRVRFLKEGEYLTEENSEGKQLGSWGWGGVRRNVRRDVQLS